MPAYIFDWGADGYERDRFDHADLACHQVAGIFNLSPSQVLAACGGDFDGMKEFGYDSDCGADDAYQLKDRYGLHPRETVWVWSVKKTSATN